MRRPHALAVVAIVVLGAVLRLLSIRTQSFWYDESLTVADVHLPFSDMLTLVVNQETTPPVYFALAWIWTHAAGTGELGLRSLSVLCGLATVPVAYAAADRLAGRGAALIVALLTATNPLLVWYSQEARSYALLLLISAISFYAFVRALQSSETPWLAGWAFAAAVALLVHYFALFLVLGEAAWLLARRPDRARVLVAIGVVVLAAFAIAPVALVQRGTNGLDWIGVIPLAHRAGQLAPDLVAGFDSAHHALLAAAMGVILLAGLAWGLVHARRRRELGIPVALSVGLTAVLVPILLALVGTDYLLARNLIEAWVPLAIAAAAGLAAIRPRVLSLVAAAAVCGLSVFAVASVASDAKYQRPNWRGLARALGPDRGHRMVVVSGYYHALPLRLYLPAAGFVPRRGVQVVEVDVVGVVRSRQTGCWWGATCNLPGAQPALLPPFHGLVAVAHFRYGQFLVVRYRSRRPVLLRPSQRDPFFRRVYLTPRVHEFFLVQPRRGQRYRAAPPPIID